MKIIHCADLHLDSKMTTNLDKEKAKKRKGELLLTFNRMVEYAVNNYISAILICGDLFDTKVISVTARNTVMAAISGNPSIDFFYLKGNHDKDNFLEDYDVIPDNLYLFDDSWTAYSLGDEGRIKIYGTELNSDNSEKLQVSFDPDPSDINIVCLHGQESESIAKDKTEVIDLRLFRNKGVNYLALGHIHEYKSAMLDGEGKYCYSGCLEGRGFDECGSHGFVVLDINEKKGTVKDEFVPFASRLLHTVYVDISGLDTTPEIISKVKETLAIKAEITSRDLLKVVLCGNVEVECDKDIDLINQAIEDSFFFTKVYDETKILVDYDSFLLDESLKGEFVRLVKASDMSEEEKGEIIRLGLHVIGGGKAEE